MHAKIDMRHACLSALALLRCFGKQIYRSDIIWFICLGLFRIILQALITYCFSCLKLNLITHVYLLFKQYHTSMSDVVFYSSVCLFIQELQLSIIYYWVIYILDTIYPITLSFFCSTIKNSFKQSFSTVYRRHACNDSHKDSRCIWNGVLSE